MTTVERQHGRIDVSVILSFRIDRIQADRLDALARAEGVNRCAYIRGVVSAVVQREPTLNIARLNQVTEYSQAALAALVDHLLGDKQSDIIAVTAQRLEQIHGQK